MTTEPRESPVEIIPPPSGRGENFPPSGGAGSSPQPPARRDPAAGGARTTPVRYLLSYVPGVPTLVALWLYLLDDDAPAIHKLSIVGTFLYFVWPMDIVKDLFIKVGYLDDLAILFGLVSFIGSEALRPYRAEARRWLRGQPPVESTAAR